ncbi:MAG: WD40/YVTN/BNR-like repeat-containing protein [Myxococcota bacterium]
MIGARFFTLCILVGLIGCQTNANDAELGPNAQDTAAQGDGEPRQGADNGAAPEASPWRLVAEGYEPGAFFSGWAGQEDVWFAGGEFGAPLIAQYNGAGWVMHDPGTGHQAWWIHGFEDGPIFVVGDAGSIARYQDGVWETMETQMPGVTLYGVWGASPDDVWAVGGPYALSESGPPLQGPLEEEEERRTDVLLHFDGTSWEMVKLPELPERSTAAQSLFKVWGTSADNVFAVGGGRLILHYDGENWTVQDTGDGSQQLFTIAGRGPDDVWAVGGGATPALLHYDGVSWTDHELPPFTPQVLQGLWTAPGAPVYISGYGGFLANLADGIWTVDDPVTTDPLHGLVGDALGGIWAAGGNIMAMSKNYRGTLAVKGRTVSPLDAVPQPTPDPVEPDAGPQDGGSLEDSEAPFEDTSEEDVGPTPAACDAPMLSCPDNQLGLFVGGPCEGDDLLCSYEIAADMEYWHFTCVDGRWSMSPECLSIGGACGIPAPSEACLGPYDGDSLGVGFELGPANLQSAFTPFTSGEEVTLAWGGQGSPMLEFRLEVDDLEAPECLSYQMTAELSAGTNAQASGTVRMRCGKSLAMYIILPLEIIDCDPSLFDLQLTVTIPGLGERVYDLTFQGGGGCFG